MKSKLITAATLGCLCALAPLSAQSNQEIMNQLKALKAQVQMLESKLAEQENKKGVDLGGGSFSLNPGPRFESADGNRSFQIGGKLHVEAATFDDDRVDHPDGTNIRRAQVVVKGNFSKYFSYAFENEFAGNASTVTDAFIAYSGLGSNTTLTIGSHKEPFSFDFLTSDESNVFIEFAPLNNFTPERSIGVSASTHGNNWSLAGGVFGQGTGTTPATTGNDEGSAITGRATYAPIREEGKVLHLGIAGTMRNQSGSTTTINVKESNNMVANNLSTGAMAADSYTAVSAELAGIYGPLAAQGRYVVSQYDLAGADADFSGYYVQASYALTGESMTYKNNGTLRRIKPKENFVLGEGIGAWEIGARYSSIDLNDGGISGGEADTYTLGLNWYIDDRARMMLNYTAVETSGNPTVVGNSVTAADSPNFVSVRAQYDF